MSETELLQEEKTEEKPEEKGIKTQVLINGDLQRRMNRTVKVCGIVGTILGAVLLLAYIAIDVTLSTLAELGAMENYADYEVLLKILLWCGAMIFVFGLMCIFLARANVKNAERLNQTNEYTFYENYFTVTSVRNGEQLGTVKQYYADFYKVKETKEFFLLYPNRSTAFPVEKGRLTEAETEELRRLLPLRKKKS